MRNLVRDDTDTHTVYYNPYGEGVPMTYPTTVNDPEPDSRSSTDKCGSESSLVERKVSHRKTLSESSLVERKRKTFRARVIAGYTQESVGNHDALSLRHVAQCLATFREIFGGTHPCLRSWHMLKLQLHHGSSQQKHVVRTGVSQYFRTPT